MGRPKHFSREGVLAKTLPVFWEHGFAHTTLQDLEAATGVNKSGLYAEFHDKEDLFLSSLRYYLENTGAQALLAQEPLGLNNIERFLKLATGCMEGQRGCFSVNSMREISILPPEAHSIILESLKTLRSLVMANLKAAGKEENTGSLADLVMTFFNGLSIEQNLASTKAGANRKISDFMKVLSSR